MPSSRSFAFRTTPALFDFKRITVYCDILIHPKCTVIPYLRNVIIDLEYYPGQVTEEKLWEILSYYPALPNVRKVDFRSGHPTPFPDNNDNGRWFNTLLSRIEVLVLQGSICPLDSYVMDLIRRTPCLRELEIRNYAPYVPKIIGGDDVQYKSFPLLQKLLLEGQYLHLPELFTSLGSSKIISTLQSLTFGPKSLYDPYWPQIYHALHQVRLSIKDITFCNLEVLEGNAPRIDHGETNSFFFISH